MTEQKDEIQRVYRRRFEETAPYRDRVWIVLARSFLTKWVHGGDTVFDLGCGYGEFINNVSAGRKLAMDLNPDSTRYLAKDVEFLEQDCSTTWPVQDGSLDVVFTSNFLEHLPDKAAVRRTLRQAFRCIRPGGKFVAIGPNIKFLAGAYWDFFDHYTPLSEASLAEALETEGFALERIVPRFLPYTLSNAPEYPMFMLRVYLRLPLLWWIRGRQFLIVAVRPDGITEVRKVMP